MKYLFAPIYILCTFLFLPITYAQVPASVPAPTTTPGQFKCMVTCISSEDVDAAGVLIDKNTEFTAPPEVIAEFQCTRDKSFQTVSTCNELNDPLSTKIKQLAIDRCNTIIDKKNKPSYKPFTISCVRS